MAGEDLGGVTKPPPPLAGDTPESSLSDVEEEEEENIGGASNRSQHPLFPLILRRLLEIVDLIRRHTHIYTPTTLHEKSSCLPICKNDPPDFLQT